VVFVIFQRLHSRDAYSGTGIGLALCKKIVEHHGGQIWLENPDDGGTRVCFTLPALPRPGSASDHQRRRNLRMSAPVQPVEALLVEDDPGDELITREAFADNEIGNTLHVVRDGLEALDFLYRRDARADAVRPDLILLDLNLPKYDGRQAAIRQIDEFFVTVVELPRRP
jgi:hypothetical protein